MRKSGVKKHLALLLLLFPLLALACQREARFKIEPVRFEQGLDGCQPDQDRCSSLSLSYLRLIGGAKAGRDRLNEEILAFALQREDGQGAKDPEAAAAALLSEYVQFKKENPRSAAVWWQKRQVEALANQTKVLSLMFLNSEYMGGAHPNQTKDFRSYDPKTGRRYGLGDWLKPGFAAPLNALGEKYFRKARGLPAGADLDEAGFMFESGFRLNDNFAATSQGILFYFNPYEVASYADGPTELVIPYSDLKEWLLPRGPLAGLFR